MNDKIDKIKLKLYNDIVSIIYNDLTIGLEDNSIKRLLDNKINNFIIMNDDEIRKVINEMINVHIEDNELDYLNHILPDQIREYLYDYIDVSPEQFIM